jgi:hypothetical protein
MLRESEIGVYRKISRPKRRGWIVINSFLFKHLSEGKFGQTYSMPVEMNAYTEFR